MSILSIRTHYLNKYPGGKVIASDSSLDVYCAQGRHRVSLDKNGAGMWQDNSELVGAEDRHDMAPIPKASRRMKLWGKGKHAAAPKIGRAEEHDERAGIAEEAASLYDGRIPSVHELMGSPDDLSPDAAEKFCLKSHCEKKRAEKKAE